MKPDDSRVEIGPRLRIDRRDVPFPGVAHGLSELADVLAIVAEMHRKLLPAYCRRPFRIDPR